MYDNNSNGCIIIINGYIIIVNGYMISSSRLTSTQCLQHNWLQKLLKNNKSTGATIDMSRLKEHLRHKSPVSIVPYNIL